MVRRFKDYGEEYFANQRPGWFSLKVVGIAVVAILVICGASLFVRWLMVPAQVFSPENVRAQWQFVYDYDAQLKAIASQWCTAKDAEQNATTPEGREQRTSQRIAIEQNYDRVKAQYDGRLRDAFRAKLVRPPDMDIPNQAPPLTQVATC